MIAQGSRSSCDSVLVTGQPGPPRREQQSREGGNEEETTRNRGDWPCQPLGRWAGGITVCVTVRKYSTSTVLGAVVQSYCSTEPLFPIYLCTCTGTRCRTCSTVGTEGIPCSFVTTTGLRGRHESTSHIRVLSDSTSLPHAISTSD